MTPAEFRIRCRISESCLPDAEYRTRLTALHDDMLAEIEATHAVGIRQEQMLMDYEALLRQAVTWLSLLCKAAGLDPEGTTVEFSDRENNLPLLTVSVAGTIAALRERLNHTEGS